MKVAVIAVLLILAVGGSAVYGDDGITARDKWLHVPYTIKIALTAGTAVAATAVAIDFFVASGEFGDSTIAYVSIAIPTAIVATLNSLLLWNVCRQNPKTVRAFRYTAFAIDGSFVACAILAVSLYQPGEGWDWSPFVTGLGTIIVLTFGTFSVFDLMPFSFES